MNCFRYLKTQWKKRPARTPAIPNKCTACNAEKAGRGSFGGNVERDKQWETERGKRMETKGEIIDAGREIKMR